MIRYGFDAVLASKRQTGGDQPIHRPYLGRLVLAGLRAQLALTARVPARRQRMADAMHAYRSADRDD